MATKNDGGPAFPRGGYEYQDEEGGRLQLSGDAQPGMSLRDWLATHAPEVPLRFPEAKLELEFSSRVTAGWSNEELEKWGGWKDWLDDCDIEPAMLAKFQAAREEMDAITRRNELAAIKAYAEREISWRYYYADLMLAAR